MQIDREKLEKVAELHNARKHLDRLGFETIFLAIAVGGLTWLNWIFYELFAGIWSTIDAISGGVKEERGVPAFLIVLVVVTVLLLAAGVWMFVTTRPRRLKIVAGIYLLAGIAVIIAVAYGRVRFGGVALLFLLLGTIFEVPKLFRFGRRFAKLDLAVQPNEESLRHLAEVVTSVLEADPQAQENIIRFCPHTRPFERWWRGGLLSDVGVFIAPRKREILFASKDEVSFEKEPFALSKTQRIALQLGSHRYEKVSILADDLKRLQGWCQGTTIEE